MTWAVVRVRGSIHAKHDIVMTLRELRLTRPNHVAIVPESDVYRGMANKAQGYVTWGPVKDDTLALLDQERVDEAAPATIARKAASEEKGKPAKSQEPPVKRDARRLRMYRLKPPRKGWRSTKKPYTLGGALGFRAPGTRDDMDALIRRML